MDFVFSKEVFVQEYNNLCTHPDQKVKQRANLYVMQFQKSNEAWSVCKELLNTSDPQIQFTGAHILTMKTKQNFISLSNEAYIELRAFLFDLVENRHDFNVPTIQRLCSAISALAVVGIGFGHWVGMIDDMIPFMQKGKKQLWIGLQVMQGLVENMDDMIIGNNVVTNIKKILISKSQAVIDIFNSLLSLDDGEIVKKSLECLESWAGFEMQMLSNNTLVNNTIKNGQMFTQIVCEILSKMMRNSLSVDLLTRNQLENKNDDIPESEQLSIQNIIRMINELPQSIHTCDLLICLLKSFPSILLNNLEMCNGLFNMYLSFVNSNQLKISANTIPFIDDWNSILKQYCRENLQPQYISIFFQFMKILIEKCKKNKIDKITKGEKALTVVDVETGEETSFNPNADDSDDDLNLEEKKMTLHDFRESCNEGFYQCFRSIRDLKGESGILEVYQYILSLMDPQMYSHITDEQTRFVQYCIGVEVAIFTAIQFIELESVKNQNCNVDKIITFIISQLPVCDITIQTSLQYLFEAGHEFKHTPQLFHHTIQFILSQFNNPKLSQQAAESLKSIIELSEQHSHIESLSLIGEFFGKAFANQNLISFPTLESLIQAVLVFTVKFRDQQQKTSALFGFLQVIQNYLEQENSKIPTQTLSRQDLERLLDILISVFQGFDLMDLKYRKTAQQIISQFAGQNIEIINNMFKQFATVRFKAFYERFIILYTFIIKSCGEVIPNEFVSFLNISLELFQSNPLKYFASLKLVNKLIIEVPNTNEVLQSWLQNNYIGLNELLYNLLTQNTTNQDPDLMKQYFEMCKNMQLHHEQILLSANFQQTLQFVLHSLINVQNFSMTREILHFLMKLVEKNHSVDYTQILGTIIRAINLLQKVQINYLSTILIQSVNKINNDQTSAMVIYQNLDINDVTEDDKKYISEELLKVARSSFLTNVKKVASALYALTSGQSNMEGFRFELSLINRV